MYKRQVDLVNLARADAGLERVSFTRYRVLRREGGGASNRLLAWARRRMEGVKS